jgi:predicted transcriptional regulator
MMGIMEVHLPPEKEAQLSRLASNMGWSADTLAQQVLGDYLADEVRFIAAVRVGEAALERGEYVTHEEVGARVERLARS